MKSKLKLEQMRFSEFTKISFVVTAENWEPDLNKIRLRYVKSPWKQNKNIERRSSRKKTSPKSQFVETFRMINFKPRDLVTTTVTRSDRSAPIGLYF